ncbi:MAG: hypothetical protein HY017_10770 [Betaproteobacteria bacterium]|nr:hypothetical protein [Betaproteobacteria bacterium]
MLAYHQAPPYWVPMRFFITAPLFAVLAGLALVVYGSDALAQRWDPVTIAMAHLLAIGFLAMTMFGALLQLVCVLLAVRPPWLALVAAIGHGTLSAGTLALAAGLAFGVPWLMHVAQALLASGVAVFIASVAVALARSDARTPTLRGIALALIALAFTAAIGMVLAQALSQGLEVPLIKFTGLHAGWGIAGWTFALVASVAYQVVPLFQFTPPFPAWMQRALVPGVFATLLGWTIAGSVDAPFAAYVAGACEVFAALALIVFAATTFGLQRRRRRRAPDATLEFWALGTASLAASSLAFLCAQVWPEWREHAAYPLLLGTLMLAGFGMSVVCGMLYKIAPFLTWLHLQRTAPGRAASRTRGVVPDKTARRHARVHGVAVGVLVAAIAVPALARPAGILFAVSAVLLAANLYPLVKAYRAAQFA